MGCDTPLPSGDAVSGLRQAGRVALNVYNDRDRPGVTYRRLGIANLRGPALAVLRGSIVTRMHLSSLREGTVDLTTEGVTAQ
jgi:hypothetical protein